jgi:hypothetical protein
MSRTIMLLELTQMSGDTVCLAGIDLASDQTVRLTNPQPTQRLVAMLGGLAPGDIVKVDAKPLRKLEPPHLEDCEWNPRSMKKVGMATLAEMRKAVEPTVFPSVKAAFGEPITNGRLGNSAWQPGEGMRSLATISVVYMRAGIDRNERPRFAFKDDALDYWPAVPMQDLRVKLHQATCSECERDHVDCLKGEFEVNRGLVRVGLTRPFSPGEGTEPMCWLQVTNILGKERQHFDTLPQRSPREPTPREPALAAAT